jgi:hypothetical protein
MIAEYMEGFQRCYPGKTVELRPVKVRREIRYRVIINGEGGDRLLSADEVKSSTRDFNKGVRL